MSHYYLIPIEAKQFFSSFLSDFKIKLMKLCYKVNDFKIFLFLNSLKKTLKFFFKSLKENLDSIYDARVPISWSKMSWTSSTLGFWFTELAERYLQLNTWCFTCRPKSFWMSGFFNPQGFLTAMKQEVAKAHDNWPLDLVTLENDVTKILSEDLKSGPKVIRIFN